MAAIISHNPYIFVCSFNCMDFIWLIRGPLKKVQMILSALCLPDFLIPHGLHTFYKCLLTTLAQDIPFQEIPLKQGLLWPQGELYISQPTFKHRSRDQLLDEFCTSFYETISSEFPVQRNLHSIFHESIGTNRILKLQPLVVKVNAVLIEPRGGGGGYSSLVLVGMCRSRIWKKPHTNTNFSRKSDPFIYQSNQFCAKYWAKSPDFSFFFPILAQIWENFEKSTYSYNEFCIL